MSSINCFVQLSLFHETYCVSLSTSKRVIIRVLRIMQVVIDSTNNIDYDTFCNMTIKVVGYS